MPPATAPMMNVRRSMVEALQVGCQPGALRLDTWLAKLATRLSGRSQRCVSLSRKCGGAHLRFCEVRGCPRLSPCNTREWGLGKNCRPQKTAVCATLAFLRALRGICAVVAHWISG